MCDPVGVAVAWGVDKDVELVAHEEHQHALTASQLGSYLWTMAGEHRYGDPVDVMGQATECGVAGESPAATITGEAQQLPAVEEREVAELEVGHGRVHGRMARGTCQFAVPRPCPSECVCTRTDGRTGV